MIKRLWNGVHPQSAYFPKKHGRRNDIKASQHLSGLGLDAPFPAVLEPEAQGRVS